MKARILNTSLLMLAVLLTGCAATKSTPRVDRCASIDNGDGTVTFKQSGIVAQKCSYGSFFSSESGRCRAAGMLGVSSKSWYDVMNSAEKSTNQNTSDWRIPTKEDLEVIGSCLGYETMWTSTVANGGQKVLAYDRGRFVETSPAESSGFSGILIRGGIPTSHETFLTAFTNNVEPYNVRRAQENERRIAEQKVAEEKEEKRRKEIMKKQAAALASSSKGTVLNCTTDDVVPVNTSVNRTAFACPSLGRVNLEMLQKNKWKVTSTERIPAQADSWREDDWGQRGWNGRGVIISIMIEKH